jgi:hypothetical protein
MEAAGEMSESGWLALTPMDEGQKIVQFKNSHSRPWLIPRQDRGTHKF